MASMSPKNLAYPLFKLRSILPVDDARLQTAFSFETDGELHSVRVSLADAEKIVRVLGRFIADHRARTGVR